MSMSGSNAESQAGRCFSEKNMERFAFYEQYDVVTKHRLVAERPIRLQDHTCAEERNCRFCGKSKGDATFRNTAHAIPELMGNKSIFSMNECDECNAFFAHAYEDHLAKWYGPMRSLCRISGKRGTPGYKDGAFKIAMKEGGLHINMPSDTGKPESSPAGPGTLHLPSDMKTQPYVPLRAAKALVKAAVSIVPLPLLQECDNAIAWLMNRAEFQLSSFPVCISFTPGPTPYRKGTAMLLKRKNDEPTPFLWCMIASSNLRFQFMIPCCQSDSWMKKGANTFTIHHYPVPFTKEHESVFGESTCGVQDWGSSEPRVEKINASFHYDPAERKADKK